MTSKTRSLMFDAASIAIQTKGATVAEIQAQLPGKSKAQVQDALHNAAARKLVKCIRRGSQPAIWGPTDMPDNTAARPKKDQRRIVTSPFQPEGIERPLAVTMAYRPLGEW